MPVRDEFYTTTAWRALRLLVLDRDGWECQRAGPSCIGRATHAGHILSRVEHPDLAMQLDNVRAECVKCNTIDGGKISGRRRRRFIPSRRGDANGFDEW